MATQIAGILFLILFAAVFVGCSKPHSTNAAKKFIRANISKSPINITVPETDKWKYWIINFEDKPDYKFWVESKKTSVFGIPTGYALLTNYNQIFSYYYLNEFKSQNSCLLSSKLDDTIHTLEKHYIEAYYSSREEAIVLANDINKYCDFVNKQKYPCKLEIWCYYTPAPNDDLVKKYRIKLYSTKEYAREIDWTSPNSYSRYLDKINIEDELINRMENLVDLN
jgi:hypothetical protein